MDPAQIPFVAAIADDLPIGIWVARAPSGEFLYANRAFQGIMGMAARDDVAAGSYSEPYGIFTRDGRPYPEDKLPFVRALQARTTVMVDDLAIHRRDGRKILVRAFGKPFLDPQGTPTAVAIAFLDVTEEVKALRARSEAEARLRQVIDNAPVILFALDGQGIITLSEGRGLGSIGFKPGELVGRSVFELYKDAPEAIANVRRALSGEEFHSKTRAGPFTFESHFAPLKDERSAVAGAIGVTTNVTESERLQAQLIQADRMASLGVLAASVAHEVNTPLTYVLASLGHLAKELPGLAMAGPQGPERLKQLMDVLGEACQGLERVKTIARDLNAFSRPNERQEALDVRDVLESALRMTSHETGHRARVARDLQEVPLVHANESRLAQVFLNLLMNAAQAFAAGKGDQNEITVSTRAEEGWVRVQVADNGPGIPEAALPHIFDPFFTTKPVGQGTGLGLSICRSIARELAGDVTVESRPGRTVFTVALPAGPRALSENSPRATVRIEGRPRVLIVDDDAALRRVVLATLSSECEVDLASSGAAALERMLGPKRYDVVLCDLMMPDMTGMEVFERLRAKRPGLETEICFMTGGAFTPSARAFLATVSNPCFEKPFDFGEVIAQVLNARKRHAR